MGAKETARFAHMSHRRERLYELVQRTKVNGKVHSFFVPGVPDIKRQFERNYTLDFDRPYNVHLIHNGIIISIIFNERTIYFCSARIHNGHRCVIMCLQRRIATRVFELHRFFYA